jgi:hypothetical protein
MRVQSFLSQAPDQAALLGGLNLINTQILDFFKPEHQAEFFRLKGLLHMVGPLLLSHPWLAFGMGSLTSGKYSCSLC